MSVTMTKKRHEVQRIPTVQEPPKERRYTPPTCSACTELRRQTGKESANYTEVYGHSYAAGVLIRYCRCKFCNHTWKVLG